MKLNIELLFRPHTEYTVKLWWKIHGLVEPSNSERRKRILEK